VSSGSAVLIRANTAIGAGRYKITLTLVDDRGNLKDHPHGRGQLVATTSSKDW
jgi:hypothetical protein